MVAPPEVDQDAGDRVIIRSSDDEKGMRLDAWLTSRVPQLSRTRAAWHILHGHVALDGPRSKLKPGFKVPSGLTATIAVQMPPPPSALPEDIPLSIVHEDDDVIVLIKPAAMVVHPGAGHASHTLINALVHHDPALADVGDSLRPGLVHRLDKDTSGLLVVARHARAHATLAADFAAHRIERRYAAICLGKLREDLLTVSTLHGRHPRERRKFSGRVTEGKTAVTHLRVIARSKLCSLVQCQLETGRTHQIRVHLSERGHPVAGDILYGGIRNHHKTSMTVTEIAVLRKLPRHALHAYALGFNHPTTGEMLRFWCPWPDDIRPVAIKLFGDVATLPWPNDGRIKMS